MSARRLLRMIAAATAALAISACGITAYYNSLYNAKRAFTDARRAAARGDNGGAAAAYTTTIERAAASYRKDSTGHWSNEALDLIGRSYFGLGDYGRARAAFEHLLVRGVRGDGRAAAQAYLGAALVRLGEPALALPPLDSAAARLAPKGELGAFARIWHARARFALNNPGDAWRDLEQAGTSGGPLGVEAQLEAAARALTARDSARAAVAFAGLLARSDASARADSVRALSDAAAALWGARAARSFLAQVARSPWHTPERLRLTLYRAGLAVAAGDTAAALAEAGTVVSGPDRNRAGEARVAIARWRLAQARDLPAADAVRGDLLPAIAMPEAQILLRSLKTLDIMVGRASSGEPLSLFAAAELARDELNAPVLARRLFLAYADMVPGAPWAPKALLAAAQLATGPALDSIRTRLAPLSASVYVRAANGQPVDSTFTVVESRLDRAISSLRASAAVEAARRDAGVTRAVAVLDSVRDKLRSDSMRVVCGAFADSLGIAGERGDSLRAACMAGDSAKVALLLKPDTMKRADSLAARRRLPGRRNPAGQARDTAQ